MGLRPRIDLDDVGGQIDPLDARAGMTVLADPTSYPTYTTASATSVHPPQDEVEL